MFRMFSSPVWSVHKILQACCKLRGESLDPVGVNQPHFQKISQVHSIFVAEGRELHPHQGLQRHDPKQRRRLALGGVWSLNRLVQPPVGTLPCALPASNLGVPRRSEWIT